MHSAIYSGWLRHRRFAPKAHAFRYGLFLVYLDLAELDIAFKGRWLWSTQRAAVARFDRADYLGDPAVPLDDAVRDRVEERTGKRPQGPIRLLTHLRYFGHCFNPVSFYYCFDAADTRVETMVAEVTNTPWGERHCYVLDEPHGPRTNGYLRYRSDKSMHVSPFMPMELAYHWGFSPPADTLSVHMSLHRGEKIFDATMCMTRAPLTGPALAKALLSFPLVTVKVVAAIHWEALRLWLKRTPIHTHPGTTAKLEAAPPAQLERGAPAARRS